MADTIESRVAELRAAGAGLISFHVDELDVWQLHVDRIEDRHACFESVEGTLDEAVADALAWLRGTPNTTTSREG